MNPITLISRCLTTPLAACFLLVACQSVAPVPDSPPPDSAEILRNHNERARSIPRLFARAVVEAEWINAKGKKESEQGDGRLIVRKPGEIALTIGKLNDVYFWLGGDVERFWWFDENPQDDRPDTAYFGRHEDVGKPGMSRLNIPVPPDQLIQLLGITEIPEDAAVEKVFEPKRGSPAVWFHVPTRLGSATVEQRILIGAISGRPLAIQFVDAQGVTIAQAKLTGYKTLKLPGVPLGGFPYVATRVEVTVPSRKTRVTLHLEGMTADEEKFKDAMFDFESLVKSREPKEIRELRPDPLDPPPSEGGDGGG